MSTKKPFCPICSLFREIPLHLHELAIYCELLNDEKIVYKPVNRKVEEYGVAKTTSIAKWLRLASQLETVKMNTFKYEMAHLYCEPVADELDSNANHDSSIATQITRFMFVSNALEEAYRLSSHLYEKEYLKRSGSSKKLDRQRYYSTQITWLIDNVFTSLDTPENYFHKVDNLLDVAQEYKKIFKVSFDMDLKDRKIASRGFSVVRIIRNHIAHAVFPIVENPDMVWEFNILENKKLILKLLLGASRLAAMNIQIILKLTCNKFKSEEYNYFSSDPDTGEYFTKYFNSGAYLNHLHIDQTFGLNESSHLTWRHEVLDI